MPGDDLLRDLARNAAQPLAETVGEKAGLVAGGAAGGAAAGYGYGGPVGALVGAVAGAALGYLDEPKGDRDARTPAAKKGPLCAPGTPTTYFPGERRGAEWEPTWTWTAQVGRGRVLVGDDKVALDAAVVQAATHPSLTLFDEIRRELEVAFDGKRDWMSDRTLLKHLPEARLCPPAHVQYLSRRFTALKAVAGITPRGVVLLLDNRPVGLLLRYANSFVTAAR
jgi:hypothetical protein